MKLTHIRLAGFKSFAEPTVIMTPGQRIAIVGPNGCGKSNLIDAVRWVLGESRASNLRGESMQDVIFSGTSQRKSLSRASVELVFEQEGDGNSPWSIYRELSVKRVMNRDGESTYTINNQTVRRKDITDLFLGSGLGARSFAIIEQGMINKIIDSKPEEMRVLLEDAAGIARYRERRRESESRLSGAKEQLQRLSDVRNEWLGQYEKLEVQAKQARQFVNLNDDKTAHEAALLMCTVKREASVLKEAEEALITLETQRDDGQSTSQKAHQQAQQSRETYDALQAQLREAQQSQAQAHIEHTRLQSSFREAHQQKASLDEALQRLAEQQHHTIEEAEAHESALPELELKLASIEEALHVATEREATAQQALLESDAAFHLQQKKWSEHQQQLTTVEQQRQTLKVKDEHIQKRLTQLLNDEERTKQRLASVPKNELQALTELIEREEKAALILTEARTELQLAETSVKDKKAEFEVIQAAHETSRSLLQSLRSRYESVRRLEVERQTENWSDDWKAYSPFWAALSVEKGWERALEVVLRERFHARSASFELHEKLHWGGVLWSVEHLNATQETSALEYPKPKSALLLADLVKAATPEAAQAIHVWCAGYIVAPSLEAALAWQQAGELEHWTAVSPEGVCVDALSIQSFVRPDDHRAVLALKAERETLETELTQNENQFQAYDSSLKKTKQDVDFAEMALKAAQQQVVYCQEQWHQLNAERRVLEERMGHNERQITEITQQQSHITQQREYEKQDHEECLMQAQEIEIQHEMLMSDRELLRAARNEAEIVLSKARTVLSEAQHHTRQLQQDAVRVESAHKQWSEKKSWLAQQRESTLKQEQALQERLRVWEAQQMENPQELIAEAEANVSFALERLSTLENALQKAQLAWKEADEARLRADRQLQETQVKREALVLSVERARLAWSYTQQAIDALGDNAGVAEALLSQGEEALKARIKALEKQIISLGSVNLVALDEVEGAKSRLNELESQHSDVQEAVLTLEEAIRRLDIESRQRLRQALESLNQALSIHFAAMFGGGTAQLIPTNTDLLSAGIQLWAEPPGKRNVSLHLLSGGEKALTAISLMLALFELNPAPFCLLDEVDAPLDDVNTARLAKMLVQLSERVQCVYISHHRLTMEVAEQLVGVTMPEAGVSKVVEVDMQSALAWAGAQKKKGVEAHG
ncbi:MAG: chromosome segregation protein SMC [Pseudomonadota bacterium]